MPKVEFLRDPTTCQHPPTCRSAAGGYIVNGGDKLYVVCTQCGAYQEC